jgi:hypothetical protein
MWHALGKREMHKGLWGGGVTERQHLEDLGPRWMNIETYLKLRMWPVATSLTTGQAEGSCKYNNDPSGSTKCGEFLT